MVRQLVDAGSDDLDVRDAAERTEEIHRRFLLAPRLVGRDPFQASRGRTVVTSPDLNPIIKLINLPCHLINLANCHFGSSTIQIKFKY